MSATNAKIAQELEAEVVTIEILLKDMKVRSTAAFESDMNSGAVQNVKDKLNVVIDRMKELHDLMAIAAATSSDSDVVARSGGGNGKS